MPYLVGSPVSSHKFIEVFFVEFTTEFMLQGFVFGPQPWNVFVFPRTVMFADSDVMTPKLLDLEMDKKEICKKFV